MIIWKQSQGLLDQNLGYKTGWVLSNFDVWLILSTNVFILVFKE